MFHETYFRFFLNWRYFSKIAGKLSIAIKITFKIPSLLQSISGQSTAYTRPKTTYMGVDASLVRFKYPAAPKKKKKKNCIIDFSKLCFETFHDVIFYRKKETYCRCLTFPLFLDFNFSFSCSAFFFCLLLCQALLQFFN